jgi:hypothetical protein
MYFIYYIIIILKVKSFINKIICKRFFDSKEYKINLLKYFMNYLNINISISIIKDDKDDLYNNFCINHRKK